MQSECQKGERALVGNERGYKGYLGRIPRGFHACGDPLEVRAEICR